MKEKVTYFSKNFICYFLTFGLVFMIGRYFIAFPRVMGSSMEPTFHEQDLLLLDKLGCRYPEDIKRGDVVVAYSKKLNTLLVKRVIGLPGETVWIKDGSVYINGELLTEDYPKMEYFGCAGDPYLLSENGFFLLGDNRNNSEDSRNCGEFAFQDIRGIVRKKLF